MVYLGHIENGQIKLEGDVALPDGASVRVELIDGAVKPKDAPKRTFAEK